MENVVDMNMFPKIYDLMKSGFGGNLDFSLNKSHHYFRKTVLHASDRRIFSFLTMTVEDFRRHKYDYL